MKISLRKKLIFLNLSLLFFVTVAASVISTYEIQKYYKTQILEQMSTQLEELEYLLANTELADLSQNLLFNFVQQTQMRISLIDSLGIVIFDSNVSRDSLRFLENHYTRPEIQMSLTKKIGYDKRNSASIHKPMFYTAKVFDRKSATGNPLLEKIYFIRLAIPLKKVKDVQKAVFWKIFSGGALALVLVAFISYFFANRLTFPIHKLSVVAESIKKGNLEAHFEHNKEDELGELADLLNQMLDKLRDDLVQLHKLEKMRTQFLGNVSHELRTPIFAVQGYLETLIQMKKVEPKKQKKFIKKAYRQTARLNSLLTDLIDISRIESGEMKMIFRNFNLSKWLNKIIDDMKETARENNVILAFVNKNDKNTFVIGDKNRLKQVILNLVNNAIKYNIPEGRVNVGYEQNGDQITIFVSDTGRGISKEHINRIFERFYRVDKERSRDVGGTGLGLAIVKHIVEAHDSRIFVKSEVNEGTTFSFSLNRADQ
ncbi:HAMP domain-containing protein [candidate division KSB1 bacterium]|nr:HAMP domain-containing protein [candidate division KSB1 bacterium]